MRSEPAVDAEERRFRDEHDRGAPPGGARELTAILPNGRTVWLRVDKPLAPASAANHVARLAERAAELRGAELAAQVRATEQLSTSLAANLGRFERVRLARIRKLRHRVLSSDTNLDERLSKARDDLRSRLEAQLKIDRENLRRLRRRDLWDKILLATSLPLFAAYGDRRTPFGTNNLTLVFLLLIWLVGDEVVEAVFGSGSNSKYALSDADAWSYLAPIGNVLSAWWLLGDRQHERFVTGVTTVKLDTKKERNHVSVNLSDRMGTDAFADFETFTSVPVVATLGAIRLSSAGGAGDPRIEGLKAVVEEGVLKLAFTAVPPGASLPLPASPGEVDIAWMVDTDKPPAAAPKS